jgi:hypothetical protein
MDEHRYLRIAVEPMDALPDVLAKVRIHGGRPVFLQIPAASPLFLTASEFRALRETVRTSNTNLVVISDDRQRLDFARLFNLIPAEDEAVAIAWIDDQAAPRPPLKTSIDPALGPPRTSSTQGWAARVDPAPTTTAPAADKVAPPVEAATAAAPVTTTALVPAKEPLPLPAAERNRRRWPWFLSLLVLLALLAGAAAGLPSSTVTLTRQRTPITTELRVAVTEPGSSAVDESADITIQGERRSSAVSLSATLPATGEQLVPDQPATGSIAFANATTAPITLSAGTVITSDGGIDFLLDADTTVPAAIGNRSGNADGTVTAAVGGEAGNLAQGALSGRHDSGLFFSNRNGALTGGTDRVITVVSEADIAAATAVLEAQLPNALADAIEATIGAPVEIVAGSVTHSGVTPVSDLQVGTEATEFTVSAETTADGLAFDPDQVRTELLNAAIARLSLPADQEVDPENAEITYAADPTNGSASTIATVLVWQLTTLDQATINELPDDLARKTVEEAMTQVSAIPGVESATIAVAPDWLPSVVRERMPLLPQRIQVRDK